MKYLTNKMPNKVVFLFNIHYICSTKLIIKTNNDKNNGKKGNFDTFH